MRVLSLPLVKDSYQISNTGLEKGHGVHHDNGKKYRYYRQDEIVLRACFENGTRQEHPLPPSKQANSATCTNLTVTSECFNRFTNGKLGWKLNEERVTKNTETSITL